MNLVVNLWLILCTVSGAGSEALPGGATLFYQTPSGLVLASPSTSTAALSPEGYVLSVPGTPAFALPPKVLPSNSEFLLFPVHLKNAFGDVR